MNADDADRRNDEAVRRIREESRRRVEVRRGWRAFSSCCALAMLAGGISLAVLGARDARLRAEEERAAAIEAQRQDDACARRAATIAQIEQLASTMLAEAPTEEVRAHIRDEVTREKAVANLAAAREGCGQRNH